MRFYVKKIILLLTLGTAFVCGISAYSAEELFGKERYDILIKKGSIIEQRHNPKNIELKLLPNIELSSKISNSWESAEYPVFISENLYLMPKTDFNEDVSKVTIEKSFEIIRSVSKMQGMLYKSSPKKTEILYKEAYCIKGPKDRTRVEDKISGSGNGVVQYCLLNDNTFGKTNYQISYYEKEQEIAADFCSTTPLNVGPIKAVEEGNLHTELLVFDCGDYMGIYILVMIKYPAISILQKKFQESFSARLDALCNWFIKQF